MASQAEAHKMLARMEMDKLHQGMVVELDRRLIQPVPAGETGGAVTSLLRRDSGDLSEALDIVQNTVAALQDYQEVVGRHEETIGTQLSRIAELEENRQSLLNEKAVLTADLQAEREHINTLTSEAEQFREQIRGLEDDRANLSAQLRQIISVIKSSFAGASVSS